MRITGLRASVHLPAASGDDQKKATYAGADGPVFIRCCISTDDGLTGNGFTGRFLAPEVAHFLNHAIADAALGQDPLDGTLASRLERRFNPRAMTGVVISALSAFEIALTDIRAQSEAKSISAFLGGCRDQVPVHVTCGLPHLLVEDLRAVCTAAVESGAAGVKVIIAANGRSWEEDAERLQAVREAIGPEKDLIADANCKLSYEDARALAARVESCRLAWLEEPLPGNDPGALRRLSDETGCPLGAGQMEQSLFRFEQLVLQGGVSVLQPNAVFAGGFAAAAAVLDLARRYRVQTCPAGGWDFVNLHLMAGLTATGAMEYHEGHEAILRSISGRANPPKDGYLRVPAEAGLGIVIDEESLAECQIAG